MSVDSCVCAIDSIVEFLLRGEKMHVSPGSFVCMRKNAQAHVCIDMALVSCLLPFSMNVLERVSDN